MKTEWLRALRFALLGLVLAYAFPAACGSGGVVGGKCKAGFVNCNGQCVNLQTDFNNCGQCANACPEDEGCGAGECDPDVPRGGSSSTGGSTGTGGNGEGATGNEPQGGSGELPDGGFFDSPVDGESDADTPVECLPPFDSPAHCGDCETRCVEPNPLCAPTEDGTSFECVPVCDPPLVECNGQCVLAPDAYQSDPENCGKCGNQCPSDICQNGKCVGARYGNIALFCMDMNSATTDSGASDLLGNAVFIPAVNPVKILAYTKGATPAAVAKVNALINAEGSARGRSASITEATAVATITSDLNTTDFHVLLIHDLDLADPGDAVATGNAWETGNTISSFTKAGGVVIVLDGADGQGEMHELITAANLLPMTGQTDITGNYVYNKAPGDVVGVNVLDSFLGTSHTCSFEVDSPLPADVNPITVISDDPADGQGDPVVIHRVIAP